MKPTPEQILSTLEGFKQQFADDDRQRQILERWTSEFKAFDRNVGRRRAILEFIGEGNATLSEIADHTGISYKTVWRITADLVAKKKIRETRINTPTSHNGKVKMFELVEGPLEKI